MRITFLYALALLLPGLARAETVTIRTPQGGALRAELFLPAGPPRGPAVVVLHGCGGPGRQDAEWARMLAQDGHVVLTPDSFGSRGLRSTCRTRPELRSVTAVRDRRGDVLAAASWLAARPGTPAGGVVLLGRSDGGTAALAAARPAPDLPPGLLRGVVALFPACVQVAAEPGWQPAAPIIVMAGEADRRTPIAACRDLLAGQPAVKLVPFAGAGHNFDAPIAQARPRSGVDGAANGAARSAVLAQVPPWIDALPPR